MANPGNIDTGGLSPQLRQVLGLDAADNQQPLVMPQSEPFNPVLPANIRSLLGQPVTEQPTSPPQNGPDYPVAAPNVPSDIRAVQKANTAYDKQQAKDQKAAQAASQRMPTVADAQHTQQAATQDELLANRDQTAVQAAAAQDQYAVNQQASADLKANADELKQQQADSDKIRLQKEGAMAAAMTEVDNYKIDRNRYFSRDGGTQKRIGWTIAMLLTGIGDLIQNGGRMTTGASPIIQQLDATLDRDVRNQEDAREQLKQKAARAEHAVDAWDRFSANKEARILGRRAQLKELVAQDLLTAAAKYGSEAALANGAKNAAEIRKGAAADAMKAVDLAHSHANQDAQLKVSQGQLGLGYAGLKQRDKEFTWQKDKDQQELDINAAKVAAAAKAKDPNEAKMIQERAMGGEVTPVKDKDGNVVGYTMGLITKKDGNTWIPQGPEAIVTELHRKHSAAMALVQTLDEIRKLGPEWLSNTANSDKKQKLDQLMGDARLQAIAAKGLGVPTGHDIELAENFLGTSDPTRWRDSLAGIMQSRASIVRDHNVELTTAGLDKPWDPPDLGNKGSDAMPDDAQTKDLLKATFNNTDAARGFEEFGVDPSGKRGSEVIEESRAAYKAGGEMFPSQKRMLDTLGAGLKSADPKVVAMSTERLAAAANSAQSPGVKAYAKDLLDNNIAGSMQVTGGEATDLNAGRAVARDTISEPRYPQPKGSTR